MNASNRSKANEMPEETLQKSMTTYLFNSEGTNFISVLSKQCQSTPQLHKRSGQVQIILSEFVQVSF